MRPLISNAITATVMPLMLIWAINSLFQTNIPYSVTTWGAMFVLVIFIILVTNPKRGERNVASHPTTHV